MVESDQLNVPKAAKADADSFELLRVWIANKGQHVSLRTGVWDDPAAWGIMLAELAKHIANSYEQTAGFDKMRTLKRIKLAWMLNWDLRLTDLQAGCRVEFYFLIELLAPRRMG